MKKKFFLVALAALVLMGCEQKQSELDIDQARSQSPATITGKVMYNPGGENSKSIAVAGVEVVALVQNYVFSAGASGETQFKAQTDSLGQYSVDIPCPQMGISKADVRLITAPMFADFTDASTGETSKVWYNVKGDGKHPLKDLIVGSVELVELTLEPEIRFKNYIGKASLSGTVTYEAGAVKHGSEWVIDNAPYEGRLLAKVVYNAGEDNEFTEEFELSTDAEGQYTLELPAGDNGIDVKFSTDLFEAEWVDASDMTKPVVKKTIFEPSEFTQAGVVKDKIYTCDHNIAHNSALDEDDDAREFVVAISGIAKTYGEVREDGSVKRDEIFLPFEVVVTVENPADNRKLVFETTASTVDGSYKINASLYNSWADANFTVKAETKQMLVTNFKHIYREYSGAFNTSKFQSKDWWEWSYDVDYEGFPRYIDNSLDSLWSFQWKEQQMEGFYEAASSSLAYSDKNNRLYKEMKAKDVVAEFEPRKPETAKGLWNTSEYNTVNDKDAEGNYSPLLKEVEDAQGEKHELRHNRYVGINVMGWSLPW